jgi:anaerobic selenocysteine-containing dehydrogenase
MGYGRGTPNPNQLAAYIANGCFHQQPLAPEQSYYRHANRAYLTWAKDAGFIAAAAPVVFQLYLEPLQKFRLAGRGHGAVQPPQSHRERIARYFDPIPFWYPPFDDRPGECGAFEFVAITQRPMHVYHSWGSHNAWLRQITAENCLYMQRARAHALGIADGDWVWIRSAIGRVKCRVRLMEGVNPDTVWTWNAIGRRPGAAALDPDAPEAVRGFLLNHLIAELLPEREGGYRFSNSDPVTGQAAWYDLRVAIEKAAPEEAGESFPRFEPLHAPMLAETGAPS